MAVVKSNPCDDNGKVWTTASSHIFFENRISSLEALLDTKIEALSEAGKASAVAAKEGVGIAMTAAKEASAKAENALDKRLEGMNEFRDTLTKQAATFVTNDKMAAEMKLFDSKLQTVVASAENNNGRGAGIREVIGWLFAGAGTVIAVVEYLTKHP